MSKWLARVLRHRPDAVGLTLSPEGGWVSVDALLEAAASSGFPLTADELDDAVWVPSGGKRRYEFSADGLRVRAVQGHSVTGVDLGYSPSPPPAELFHGTWHGAVDAIRSEGLRPMRRQHVHLSGDVETAVVVGRRRGRPVVFSVSTALVGGEFLLAPNGVWLCDAVPPEALTLLAP